MIQWLSSLGALERNHAISWKLERYCVRKENQTDITKPLVEVE